MRKYKIVPHTNEYEKMFETVAKLIANIFSDEIISIDHVGSTSVKGLGGKPTIDILVVIKDINKFDQYKNQMITAGYELLAGAVPDGWLFIKNIGDERVENIHFFEIGHPEIKRMLIVRDYLRKQPLEVKKYFEYKKQLLRLFPEDYSEYRRKKNEYFQQLMERAILCSINK